MPKTMLWPFRSQKRSNSLPTFVNLPDSSHNDPGSATGNKTSCPPKASISSRMIASIFLVIRLKTGSCV
jgi:hypothetical protein